MRVVEDIIPLPPEVVHHKMSDHFPKERRNRWRRLSCPREKLRPSAEQRLTEPDWSTIFFIFKFEKFAKLIKPNRESVSDHPGEALRKQLVAIASEATIKGLSFLSSKSKPFAKAVQHAATSSQKVKAGLMRSLLFKMHCGFSHRKTYDAKDAMALSPTTPLRFSLVILAAHKNDLDGLKTHVDMVKRENDLKEAHMLQEIQALKRDNDLKQAHMLQEIQALKQAVVVKTSEKTTSWFRDDSCVVCEKLGPSWSMSLALLSDEWPNFEDDDRLELVYLTLVAWCPNGTESPVMFGKEEKEGEDVEEVHEIEGNF
uniref:Uncharacterized protein At2g19140 n=1 Tax=Arabidopsis thaliana TaxID=3702 RepID=O64478_ARATH|nr:unknown protein [Arabidopsis thaliana]